MKNLYIFILLGCFILSGVQAQETEPQDELLPPRYETTPQEGKKKLSEMDLPEAVRQAFSESEYQGMAIIGVYQLSEEALDDIINVTQGPKPHMLYEIHVASGTRIDIIYFTRDGTMYEVAKKV